MKWNCLHFKKQYIKCRTGKRSNIEWPEHVVEFQACLSALTGPENGQELLIKFYVYYQVALSKSGDIILHKRAFCCLSPYQSLWNNWKILYDTNNL